jgi:ATP-dependent helicase HrpB
MLKLPVHPRLARIALECSARGLLEEGALVAALLSERDIARENRAQLGSGRASGSGRVRDVERGPSDVLDRMERFEQAGSSASGARALDLDPAAVAQVARVAQRLRGQLDREGARGAMPAPAPTSDAGFDAALLISVLSGFGDRVAKRRAPSGSALVLGRGGSLTQAESSVVRDAELVVVLDAREAGREKLAYLVSAIEPEWLLELWPERVAEIDEVRFEPSRERVEATTGLSFDGIVLDQQKGLAEPSARTSALLAQAARERQLFDLSELERFERRVVHACRADGALDAPPSDLRERALLAACEGLRTFAELRNVRLLDALIGVTPPAILAALDRLAPESLRLPSGRSLPIHYEPDRPPWVASRLQDFFGMKHGPRLGSVPLVLHLLAPNQRPVQVTTDLEGFWQRHYPELRTQLMRRYPRHAFPEDPLRAEPPTPRPAGPRARRK